MVTRQNPQEGARRPLYVEEWMEAFGLSDEALGRRLGVARQTIFRYRTEQHRLNPEKMEDLAKAMGIKARDLFEPPKRRRARQHSKDEGARRSVDALLADATARDIEDTIAFVERYVLKRESQG